MITILCGKSGSGKDTLLGMLKDFGFKPLISTTSRPMRDGECEGREYYFVSKSMFLERLENGKMLEYRKYNTLVGGVEDTWYYGLERRELDDKGVYVVILDLQGAEACQKAYPGQTFTVYVETNDKKRREWAEKRGSFDKTEWDRRFEDDERVFSDTEVARVCDAQIKNNGNKLDLLTKFVNVYYKGVCEKGR